MKETVLKKHQAVEFSDLASSTGEDPLAIATFGEAFTGKTRFIVTAPGPVGVVSFDMKTRKTLEKVRDELYPKKRILFPKDRDAFLRVTNPMTLAMMPLKCANYNEVQVYIQQPLCCQLHYYRWHVNRAKDAVWSLAEHKDVRTIAIDGGHQLYEDILCAIYGKSFQISKERVAYAPANEEFRSVINSVQNKHLIITSQAKDEYKRTAANPDGIATGRGTVKGFGDIGYYVGVLVEHTVDFEGKYSLSVRMCQEQAMLQGDAGKNLLSDDQITFQNLAMYVRPDADASQWE